MRKFPQFLKCRVLVSKPAVRKADQPALVAHTGPKLWPVSPGDRRNVSLVEQHRQGRLVAPSPLLIAGYLSSNRPAVALTFKIPLA